MYTNSVLPRIFYLREKLCMGPCLPLHADMHHEQYRQGYSTLLTGGKLDCLWGKLECLGGGKHPPPSLDRTLLDLRQLVPAITLTYLWVLMMSSIALQSLTYSNKNYS